jgi:DNA polymerase III sliding clamp (beta) subunit (PCNA family)
MLNRHNLRVAEFASDDASRISLNGILVSPEATVATNGHYLAWVSTPTGQSVDSFPIVAGAPALTDTFKPFILGTDAARDIAKSLPKKTTIPILANAGIGFEAEKPVIVTTDLENPKVFRPHALEGQFPNFDVVMPKDKPTFQITVNSEYLAKIAKAFSDFQPKTSKGLRMSFYDKGSSIRFDAVNGDTGQGMTAVLMPIRDDFAPLPHTYGWKKPEKPEAPKKDKKKA